MTGNMSPWIRRGDQVFVRRWDIDQIRAGDVVLFERNQEYFVHRVLRRDRASSGESLLITKGDALEAEDGAICSAEFLGRATRIHRKNRHIDIESLGQTVLGRILAQVSAFTFVLYAPVRFAAGLFR
jgi:signal peptidase I